MRTDDLGQAAVDGGESFGVVGELGELQRTQLHYSLGTGVNLYYRKTQYDRTRVNPQDTVRCLFGLTLLDTRQNL